MDRNCHFLTIPWMAELCSREGVHLPVTACGGGGGSRGSSRHPRVPLCWWACRAWGFPMLPQMPPCCSSSGNRQAMARLSPVSAGTVSLMPVPPKPSCTPEDPGVSMHLRWGGHLWPFQPRAFVIRFCSYMKALFFPLLFSSSLPLVFIRAETSAETLGSGRAGPQDMEPASLALWPRHFAETSAPSQETCN